MDIKNKTKNSVKRLLAKNSYINAAIYTGLSKKSLREMKTICNEARSDDSIADISWLRNFRKQVDEGSRGFYTTDCNFSNSHIYGIWDAMFGDLGINPIYTPSIEHGLIFHDQIFNDIEDTARAACVTFGTFRKEIIRKYTDLPIFCVGPYIHYAETFYDYDRIDEEKKKNGRTLLVFPMHSTNNSELSVQIDNYIKCLHDKEREFDTILINTFWWNINDPLTMALEAEGYRIVSAGFRDDVMFLRRLKTLILMSDLVVGDSIGTHVGYCIDCGVPFSYEPLGSRELLKTEKENQDLSFHNMILDTIAYKFANSTEITEDQIDVCNYYWGNDQIRTKDEFKEIAEFTRTVVITAKGNSSSYGIVSKRIIESRQYEKDSLFCQAII